MPTSSEKGSGVTRLPLEGLTLHISPEKSLWNPLEGLMKLPTISLKIRLTPVFELSKTRSLTLWVISPMALPPMPVDRKSL